MKFWKLDQIPRMATRFSDDQCLLYMYTSAQAVEPTCEGIHIRYDGYKQCVWVGFCVFYVGYTHTFMDIIVLSLLHELALNPTAVEF